MNQLELLSDYKRQVVRDRIADANAVYLGDVYIYFGPSTYTIRTMDFVDPLKMVVTEPLDFIMTKEYIIDYVRSNFFGGATVTMAGFGETYIDGKSELSSRNIDIFIMIKSLIDSMQLEYEEFIDYLNYHLDEIIANGGRY